MSEQCPQCGQDLPVPISSDEDAHEGKRNEPGIGLCLSGGGFRAMLFHLGAIWRLTDAGVLGGVARISSVSGGSIIAGFLGLRWNALFAAPVADAPGRFKSLIADPLLDFVDRTQGPQTVVQGALALFRQPTQMVKHYEKLLDGKTLQDLPDTPRFVINATNLETGRLWRFSKPYMADWKIGKFMQPKVSLAVAVAASAGFPPVLSPIVVLPDPATIDPKSQPVPGAPIPKEVHLTDGGVYDNLGMETVWKRYHTVLVSDGGAPFDSAGWFDKHSVTQMLRVSDILVDQVRALRKIQLMNSYKAKMRDGAYWATTTDLASCGVPGALPFGAARAKEISDISTGLRTLPKKDQLDLVRWGYAVCDGTLRKYYKPELPPPGGYPL